MNEQNKQVPTLRFRGFTDDWEQHKFSEDMVSFHTGTNLTGKISNTGEKLLKMGNMNFGSFDFKKIERLPKSVKIDKTDYVKYGDFLFNTRNTLELVGKGATWMSKNDSFVFNNNIARLNLKNINTFFFNYYYNSQYMGPKIHSLAVGTTSVAAIYPRDLKQVNYYLPLIPEQNQLSKLFVKLDELITLQQRKLDLLKQLKKGLLQKMFADKDSKRPILRFEGFNDEWERRSFGDILINHPYKKYLTKPTNKGSYKVIQQGEHPLAGYASGQPFMRYKNVTLFGDHTCSLYKPTEPFFLATDGLKILSAENVMGYYLYTLLENYGPKLQGYKRHFNTLKSTNIKITYNLNEQRKISKLLYSADKILTNQQEKISKLNEIKKSLLQQMFI